VPRVQGAGQPRRRITAPVTSAMATTPVRLAAWRGLRRALTATVFVLLAAAAGAGVVTLRFGVGANRLDRWRELVLILTGRLRSVFLLATLSIVKALSLWVISLSHRVPPASYSSARRSQAVQGDPRDLPGGPAPVHYTREWEWLEARYHRLEIVDCGLRIADWLGGCRGSRDSGATLARRECNARALNDRARFCISPQARGAEPGPCGGSGSAAGLHPVV
jgi:hypothetical protein